MKVCDPMAGALSGRSQVRKLCRTRQRAGPQSRLLTYLGHKEASCVSPGVAGKGRLSEKQGFLSLMSPAYARMSGTACAVMATVGIIGTVGSCLGCGVGAAGVMLSNCF